MNEYTLRDTLFNSLYGYDEGLGYWTMVDRIGPIETYPLIDINEIGYYSNQCLYWFVCAPYVYLSAYRDDTYEYVWFVCNPTSVVEIGGEEELEVYPNPTSGLINIEGEEVTEVQVYNSFGQLVKTFLNVNIIDLGTMPKGIYMLIINDAKDARYTTKIVLE